MRVNEGTEAEAGDHDEAVSSLIDYLLVWSMLPQEARMSSDAGLVDPVELLRERVAAAGSQVEWARAHGLVPDDMKGVMTLRRPPGRKVLHALGLKKVVTVTYRRQF